MGPQTDGHIPPMVNMYSPNTDSIRKIYDPDYAQYSARRLTDRKH